MTDQLQENPSDSNLATSANAGSTPRQSSESTRPNAEVEMDDAGAALCYANFCRATGTPEELILDFGLNTQPFGMPTRVEIKQRLVVNYFTAKRLFQALGMSIQRHEAAFGMLETDIQKRVVPGLRRTASAG